MNNTVVMTVIIIEIMLDIIEGNPRPSGACSIYPNAISVHTIAGTKVIIYGFSF